MASIYIVTSGEYSDYGINAIFDAQEKAEAYIAYERTHRKYWRPNIEEWELNEGYDPISRGLTCFQVRFEDATKGDAKAEATYSSREEEHHYFSRTTERTVYYTWVWAKDEASALKIANERRVHYLWTQASEQASEAVGPCE